MQKSITYKDRSLFSSIFIYIFLNFSVISFAQNNDIKLLEQINLHRNTKLDAAYSGISKSIYPVSLGAALGTIGAGFIKDEPSLKQKGYTQAASLALSMATTYTLKRVINRERPYVTYPHLQPYYIENDPSLPSGHTTAAFSAATSLTMAFPKWYVAVPAFAYAGAVGYSRMHLGVHYPTDVLAGAAIGAGSAWVTHRANKWIQHRKSTRKNY